MAVPASEASSRRPPPPRAPTVAPGVGRHRGPAATQLPRALRHHDGEGVEDDEAAHAQGDDGEGGEPGVDDAQPLLGGVGALAGAALAGRHLHAVAQSGTKPSHQLGRRHAVVGRYHDVVDPALSIQQPLGRGQVEQGVGRPAHVHRAPEGHRAHDPERAGRAGEEDRDLVTHGQTVVPGRGHVDHHVVVPLRGATVGQDEGRDGTEPLGRSPDGGGGGRADLAAVLVQELGIALDQPGDVVHSVDGPDALDDVVGHGLASGAGPGAAAEGGGASHLGVAVGRRLAEHLAHAVADGVAQHERGGEERHAQHDGEGGEQQAEALGHQPLESRPKHLTPPSS